MKNRWEYTWVIETLLVLVLIVVVCWAALVLMRAWGIT